MSGIVFFQTRDLTGICNFYRDRLNMDVWLDQGGCMILENGNLLIGFCQRDNTEVGGVITFVYNSKEAVDGMHKRLGTFAADIPKYNPIYKIYHFYASDPDGRTLEFQFFAHPIRPMLTAEQALLTRRSIREYTSTPVSDEMLMQVFELCRFAPTARNSQAYYYIVIKEREILERIVELRGPAGKPILAAPYAIAVGAKGDVSPRKVQDACIAAYHLLLAAKTHGLGTCWVTDMDQPEIKKILDVPEDDYIACLTPIGYPDEFKPIPQRHAISQFVRYL